MKIIIITLGIVLSVILFLNFNNDKDLSKETESKNSVYVDAGKSLDLSSQKLTKTPEYVFNETSLESLNLSNNLLEGSLQSQIGNLKNLKSLDLSNNKFTGVPAEIGRLSDLEILNLSNNKITGLPHELANLSKLKILDLSGNNYSKVDLDKIKQGLPSTTIIKTQ